MAFACVNRNNKSYTIKVIW